MTSQRWLPRACAVGTVVSTKEEMQHALTIGSERARCGRRRSRRSFDGRGTTRLVVVATLAVAQVVVFPFVSRPAAEAATSMTIAKSAVPANGTTVSPGNTITYSVDVTNTGDEPLTFLEINDTLPSDVTYVPGSSTITGARQVRQYRDEFNVEQYTNSDGVTAWSGLPWVEPTDGGSPTGGDIQIDSDNDQNPDEDFVLIVTGRDEAIRRPIDLSGCASARVTFDWRPKDNLTGGREVYLELFDGAAWTRQAVFTGSSTTTYTTYTQTVPPQFLVAGAQLRFYSNNANNNRDFYVDNLEVDAACDLVTAGTAAGAPAALVQSTDNYAIAPLETVTVTFEVTVDGTAVKDQVLTNVADSQTEEVATITSNTVSHTVVTSPSLLGTVYFDADLNGALDAGDPSTGLTLFAKLVDTGSVIQVVPVDIVTGTYELVEVSAGTYTVVLDDNSNIADTTATLPGDWTFGNPPTGVLTATSGGDGSPNVAGLDFGLNRSADVELSKTIADPTPYAGGTVSYTLTLTNQGPAATSDVVVNDQLPAGVTYISHSGTGSYDPVLGEWSVAALSNGQSVVLTVLASVDANPVGTTVTNDADVDSMLANDPDSTPGNGVTGEDDDATVDFTVSPPPTAEVGVVKSVDVSQAGVGDMVAYTIDVTNNGPEAISGGVLTDVLPPELGFQTYSTTPIGNGVYDPVSGEWLFGALAVGQTATLRINAELLDPGSGSLPATVINTATVDVAPAADPNAANDTDDATFAVPQVDLELDKQVNGAGSATVEILTDVTFTLTLTNNGPVTATGVVVDDLLPSGFIFDSATATLGAYDQGLWTIPTMPVGTATLDIVATVALGGRLYNTAEVIDVVGVDPDSTPGNGDLLEDDMDRVSVTVTNGGTLTPGLPGAICYPIADGPGSLGISDLLTRVYRDTGVEEAITVGNAGTGTSNIEASAMHPVTGVLYSAEQSGTTGIFGSIDLETGAFSAIGTAIGSGTGFDSSGNPATGNFNDIDGMHFDPQTGNLFASVRRSGLPDLLIQIDPATGTFVPNAFDSDSNPGTQEDYVEIVPVSGLGDIDALAIDLDGTLYGAANAGTTSTQRLVRIDKVTGATTNVGIVFHNGSQIQDIEGMSFDNQGQLYITTGNGGALDSGFYDLDKTPDVLGRVNTLTYTALGLGDDYEALTCGLPPTDVALTKTVDDSTPSTGDTVTFTIEITNNGPTIATGIKVTDIIPAGLSYVSHVPSKGAYVPGTGVWSASGLTVGSSATLTITATVTAGFGTSITNTATVTRLDQPDLDPTNDTDSAELVIGVTLADIRGAVYNDDDGNGLIAPDDTPIEGVTISLYEDNDDDGVPDGPAIAVTTTLADGTYVFQNLPNGQFLVIETDLPGYASVTDADGANDNTITVVLDGSGTNSNGNDFLDIELIPELGIAKALTSNADEDGSGDVSVGDTLSYSVTATNTGLVPLTDVVVTDDLISPSSTTCATVVVGATCLLTGTYVVTAADVAAGSIVNNATADADETSPVTDSVTLPVPSPSLLVDKPAPTNADEDGSGDVSAGDTLTYTITATNNGTATLTNVAVSDGLITATGGTTPCALVAPGATCTLIGTYVVTAADVTAGQVDNTGTADSDQTGPVTDDETVPVPTPASAVDKPAPTNADEDGSGDVSAGDTLTYTITATNSGGANLTNVVVSDGLIMATGGSTPCALVAPAGTCTLIGTYVVTAAT